MTTVRIETSSKQLMLEIKSELPHTWSTDSSMKGRLVMYITNDPCDTNGKIGIIVAGRYRGTRNIIVSPTTGIRYGYEAIKHIWELAQIPVTIKALIDIIEEE